MGPTQSVLYKNILFYTYAHNSSPKGSPDMILSAFYIAFHEKKDELPPEAWNPKTKIPKNTKSLNKLKNATQNGPPEPPPARPCGGSGERQPPGWLKLFRHYGALAPTQTVLIKPTPCINL